MGALSPEFLVTNARWAGAAPTLSVLTPFLRDDPTPLIEALGRNPGAAELIILDDGTNDPVLAEKVAAAIEAFPGAARFIRSTVNLGRSAGRNRLIAEARAAHVLFLDADMLPDNEDFLQRYDTLVREK
ncbi:MAG: glycosyltransferase, partial [Caulobacterales bacterium]